MISKLLNLKEVVVFGKGKKRDYSELQRRLGRKQHMKRLQVILDDY